jgi:aspartyl/asparaginyl beta-hydroxylase (cupin superfamily)
MYPDMKYIFDNRNIIIDEYYKNIEKSNNWTNWIEYDQVSNTPIFTNLTKIEILDRLKENSCKLSDGKSSWKLYGLKLYGDNIEDNVINCPKTMEILNKSSNIINAGFSCLEPNVQTILHRDFNHDIWRCHIPIYIPKGNAGIYMNDEIKMWDMNNYFIFDDTYDHQAWNYTDENRIVLILDILKKKL